MRASASNAYSRDRGGILFKALVFLVIVAACAALAWMLLLPVWLTRELRSRTGFDATVERFSLNPISGHIDLRGLVLTNPPTFPAPGFVELGEFRGDVRATSLLSDQWIFNSMAVHLVRVTFVKREDGATNAEIFRQNMLDTEHRLVAPKPSESRVLIHRLDLKIDQMVFLDPYQSTPIRKEYALGFHQNYVDVTDFNQLLGPAALKSLAPVMTAVSSFLPVTWGGNIMDQAKAGRERLKAAGQQAEEKVKGFFDALEESKKP
jgi:hypothetical protein